MTNQQEQQAVEHQEHPQNQEQTAAQVDHHEDAHHQENSQIEQQDPQHQQDQKHEHHELNQSHQQHDEPNEQGEELANSQLEKSQNEQHNRMDEEEEQEKLISILDFDPENNKEPILTSPRSLMACQISGIHPKMLIKKKPEEIYKMLQYKSNLNEEGLQILSENFEKRRLQKVEEVIKSIMIEIDDDRNILLRSLFINEVRENIINDNLTRDERKVLQESIMLKNNSQMMSQYKTESNYESQQRSVYHPNEYQSNISQVVNARLEKSKYLQKREIENMIGGEIRTHRLIQESDKKDQRLIMIAQQKEIIRQRRRKEFEENQLIKKQNLEKLRQKDDILRHQKEQEFKKKQDASNQNLIALKSMIQKLRIDESNKKMMKTQHAFSTIIKKDEETRMKVEQKYLEKEDKFQKRQDLFRQYIHREGQKRDDHGYKAMEKYIRQNQEHHDKLEKKRMEQEKKQQILEERQRMIEKIRQTQQINQINQYLHKEKKMQSAQNLRTQTLDNRNSDFMGKLESNEQKKHERDILRERFYQEKMLEKRMKEEETLRKKQLIVENEQMRKHEKYILKEKAVTEKAQRLEKEKKWFFQTQSNKKLIKTLNAQENIQIQQNQQEQKKAAIHERLSQFEERRNQREQELKRAANEKEAILRKIEISKQALKQDLNKLFQRKQDINIESISHKYNIQLDSEEQIMSRSMVDFDKPTRELQSSHSPSRNLHTSQQGNRTKHNQHSRNHSDLKDQHQNHHHHQDNEHQQYEENDVQQHNQEIEQTNQE